MRLFDFEFLMKLVIYVTAVGLSVKLFSLLYKRLWNIELTPKELAIVGGGTPALFLVWGADKGQRVVAVLMALTVVGFFAVRLRMHFVRPPSN